ncbi:MAG TPA: molybdate ABC transporter substrate-binding protein [Bryobacteraceae bacterium]|nr:molybdate ABC transporter substrate-binding protein [Bryobacteraceae bacterium]
MMVVLTACRHEQPKPMITVAAAANLTEVFGQIGPRFETQSGIHPVFSFGSTAQLALQIENSAPFDVFAAADSEHVAQLERKGLLAAGSRAIYARGVLALWFPDGSEAGKGIEDLNSPRVRVVAIAKPDLAPYGQAAVDTLLRLGIWEQVKPKVVYAENISMAKQYGKSKNADAVFTAYSLVLHESGKIIRVDERLHQPIDQELGIPAKSDRQDAARKFTAFLLRGEGKSILASFGYNLP